MDRAALHAALHAAEVPGGYYRIEGVHEPAPPPVDFLYLRRAPDEPEAWETGAYERGRWEPVARHRDESAACVHLLRLLTRAAPGRG
ncbi:hypothetical protein [Streptomyces sp. NPDC056600]|uniref:hypothetical protein n=1 Tax=Streptomyces sp. NPDC056600 TaxID=3345874 RepID=UPI0036CC8DA7